MRPRYIIWASILFLSACTAYRNNIKATGDEKISGQQLKELSVNDKVNILLTTGHSFTGKVILIGEESIVVKIKKEMDQTIYFSQIKRIKYDVNQGVTALKVTGAAALVSFFLFLLFPPQFDGSLISF